MEFAYNVRIDVTGHASSRWRGAHNTAEAQRLNDDLSRRRAVAARMIVEDVLRREIPGVKFDPAPVSTASIAEPHGFTVGSTGVGSSQPIVPGGPQENEQANRSVEVGLDLGTTIDYDHKTTVIKHKYAPSKKWRLQVNNLNFVGTGVVVAYIQFTLQNLASNKKMLFHAAMAGGGANTDPIGTLKMPKVTPFGGFKPGILANIMQARVGEPVDFTTEEEQDFDDWTKRDSAHKGIIAKLERVDARLALKIPRTKYSIGYGAKVSYLTLIGLGTSLGKDAQMLLFEHSRGIDDSNKLVGFAVSGPMYPLGPNPGEAVDVATTQISHSRQKNLTYRSQMVLFDTGQAVVPPGERQQLENFVRGWARLIAGMRASGVKQGA